MTALHPARTPLDPLACLMVFCFEEAALCHAQAVREQYAFAGERSRQLRRLAGEWLALAVGYASI